MIAQYAQTELYRIQFAAFDTRRQQSKNACELLHQCGQAGPVRGWGC